MNDNLWPDFNVGEAPRSPKTVIEDAGSGLKEKTNGKVWFYTLATGVRDNVITARFSLYSQSLGYHYPFLVAKFTFGPVYPVTLVPDKMPEVKANNEEELIAALTKIFNAPTTKETIEQLMALGKT
jgi:hypothetical protein